MSKQPTPETSQGARKAVSGVQKMTPSEAFVETLVANGVTDIFGIVGSAYMDAMDLFPPAGIRFIPVVHEQGAGHMADGYARVSGRHGVVIGAERPGHHQLRHRDRRRLLGALARSSSSRPRPASMGMGLGGFQEADQLPIFQEFTKYQGARQQPGAHGRVHRALLRPRDARDGADAAQHPARLLLRRDRLRDPAAAARRARRRRRGEPRRGRRTARRARSSRSSSPAAASSWPTRSRNAWRWPSGSARRSSTATCTTIRSPPAIRCGAARSATRARRRR